jgi:hypothetical protein
MDDMTDDAPLDSTDGQQVAAGAVRHLTYGQIGERFGMSADAARQLVRRRGWCRSRPNAIGQPVVVGVPEAELTGEHPRPTTDDESPDIRRMINGAPLDDRPPPLENNGEFDDSDRRSVLSVTVGALRSAVGLLGQQLEAERRRADAAQAQVEGLHRDLTAAEAAAREARRAPKRRNKQSGRGPIRRWPNCARLRFRLTRRLGPPRSCGRPMQPGAGRGAGSGSGRRGGVISL